MSIWNKVLLGLIIVAVLPFAYFGARTLQTHKHWKGLAQSYEKKVDETEKRNEVLELGNPADPAVKGLDQVRLELHKLLVDRGRIWRDVTPVKVEQTGKATVAIELPEPHGIGDRTVLYVFEQDGGRYLGEFKVTAINDKQVELEPTRPLTDPVLLANGTPVQPLAVLGQSKGPWILCDLMPVDSCESFAGMTPDELKTILPADTVNEYLKNGQPATPDDPERYVVDGKFVRPLRDYDTLFRLYDLHRTQLRDLLESATRDSAYMKAAVDDAKKQQAFAEQEVADLKTQLAEVRREVEAVTTHQKQLEQALSGVRKEIDATMAANEQMAAEIAQFQREAAKRAGVQASHGNSAPNVASATP